MKFKNFIFLFITLILIIITMPCQANLEKIIQRGKLIVALPTEDYSIFIYKTKQGQLTGFDIELVQNIAKNLGVAVEYIYAPHSWDQLPLMIAENKADIAIGSISITLNRAKYAAFTMPYADLNLSLFISRKWMAQHHISFPYVALKKYPAQFGVMYGSAFIPIIQNTFPLAKLKYYDGLHAKMQALLDNQVDAIATNDVTALNYIKQNPAIAFKYKMLILTKIQDPIGILVSYKNQDLLYWLNLYLSTRAIKYDAKQLLQHYFTYKTPNSSFG